MFDSMIVKHSYCLNEHQREVLKIVLMVVCSEGSEKEIVLEEFLEKKSLSLAKVLVGGIK